jgi:hypothetical protein
MKPKAPASFGAFCLVTASNVRVGSLASILKCQRHVRLDRDLGHAGGTGEEFRAGIQRSVDKGWEMNRGNEATRGLDWVQNGNASASAACPLYPLEADMVSSTR